MAELEAKKRDNIPKETMMLWFRDFKNRGWDKQKFDEQFRKVIDGVTFGVVKIDDFLKEEKTFTQKEVDDLLEQRINKMIYDANLLMRHYKIEIELEFEVPVQKTAIEVMVANKLLPLLERAEKETALDIIDECFYSACERLELNLTPANDKGKVKTKLRKYL
jgi:hypothetical protein